MITIIYLICFVLCTKINKNNFNLLIFPSFQIFSRINHQNPPGIDNEVYYLAIPLECILASFLASKLPEIDDFRLDYKEPFFGN
jgi:hypothetical protein